MKITLPTFLPGRFVIAPGNRDDYVALERFHYIPTKPATFESVWIVRYCENEATARGRESPRRRRGLTGKSRFFTRVRAAGRIVALGVLSYPFPFCTARERFFKLVGASYRHRLRFANRNIRTITRVIVHPQFRSLGLAVLLVDCLCKHCPTRYVEATAAMGRVHPFFERAGMRRCEPEKGEGPVYFLMDRGKKRL